MENRQLFKLMLIDDEPRMGRRLAKIIGDSDLPVQIVGTFVNSLEGLEQARVILPDIIITDICMPQMNGIEFATEIKSFIPECQIIFISAYSDKEYLKAAISLRAIRYVEKPFVNEDILEAVQLTIASAEEYYHRLHILEQNQHLKVEQGKAFRRRAALELLTSGTDSAFWEDVHTFYPEFEKRGKYFTFICKVSSQELPEELISELKDGIDSCFPVCLSAQKDARILVVHVGTDILKQQGLVSYFFEKMQNKFLQKAGLFVAVGRIVTGMENIYCSYMDAVICLKRLFFLGYNRISFFEPSDEEIGTTFECEDAGLQKFQEALEKDRFQDAADIVMHQYHKMRDPLCKYEINSIKNVYYRLFNTLYLVCNHRGAENVFDGDNDLIWEKISKKDTIFALQEYLEEKLAAFRQVFMEKSKESRIILRIKQYVEEHYREYDLSVNQMAEDLCFTPAYLCRIFKKETGNTINAYITDFRILKSKKLLKERNIKLYEISGKVGYTDQNYFSRQFKKREGITPSEFREKYFI